MIVVKRATPAILAHLRELGKKWIFDCVDFWPQPHGNEWGRDDAIKWLKNSLAALNPTAMVFPTRQMFIDSGWNRCSLILPHHARPSIGKVPVREKVQSVVYEGSTHYLGKYQGVIEQECAKRGWGFEINPRSVTVGDIGIAVRDFDGWPARAWKSNVKLANIHAAGIPAICVRECGYLETAHGSEFWVDDPSQIAAGFDRFTSYEERKCAQDASVISLEHCATVYKNWLEQFA